MRQSSRISFFLSHSLTLSLFLFRSVFVTAKVLVGKKNTCSRRQHKFPEDRFRRFRRKTTYAVVHACTRLPPTPPYRNGGGLKSRRRVINYYHCIYIYNTPYYILLLLLFIVFIFIMIIRTPSINLRVLRRSFKFSRDFVLFREHIYHPPP